MVVMIVMIVLLVAVCAAFVLAQALILPKIFFRNKYVGGSIPDYGCKIIDEGDGKTILYEPDPAIRKYIPKYLLSERNGKKFFECRYADALKYLDYDVVLFNDNGRSFKVINVKESVKRAGFGKVLVLPGETAYVTIILNRADDEIIKQNSNCKITGKNITFYLLCACALDIIGVTVVKVCVSYLFGGVFTESFMSALMGWGITGVLCLGLIVLNIIYTILVVRFKGNGVRKEAKNVRL